MTTRLARKLRPADRIRPPSYVDRETGAAELCVTAETWDAMVAAGELPPPSVRLSCGPRWRWIDVADWEPQRPANSSLPERPYIHEGIVYLIGFGSYVKIGWTKDHTPRGRIDALQIGCPEALEIFGIVPGPIQLERELHQRFASLRTVGEWFRKEGELAAWIEEGCPI